MILHALTIAGRRSIAVALATLPALSACARPASYDPVVLSEDQAWVAATCDAGSPADTTWQRHRLGGITIAVPPRYQVSKGTPYSLVLRGRGSLTLLLHRNAKYEFDVVNRPRPLQNWCRASFSGYSTEVVGWKEHGLYGIGALWEATWGGEDTGTWLFARMTATRIEDARLLRAVLHTVRPAADTVP